MTLKTRFSLIFLSFILLVLVLFTGAYYFMEQRSEIRRQRQYGLATLDKIASICLEANLEGNWISAVNHLKLVKKSGDIVFADCLDGQGKAWAHSESGMSGVLVARKEDLSILGDYRERDYAQAGREIREIAKPIRHLQRPMGIARIGYDSAHLKSQVEQKLWDTLRQMALVGLLTLVVAWGAAFFVARSLTWPISALVFATKEIKGGRLDYQSAITGRKDELGELAAEFNMMARHLRDLDEIKRMFVDSITHDLRAPVTVIKGYMSMLLDSLASSMSAEQADQMRTVEAQTKRLELYISNLLDYSKLQVGELPMQRVSLSIGEIAESAVKAFSGPARMQGVGLEARVEGELPSINGDQDMISRVVANLISNAMKFTPSGGKITVSVGKEDERFLRVAIEDTGIGIPPEDLERVFGKFFQVGQTRRKAKESGTGLGLTICKRFVEQHGGKIWARSALNVGTTLTFTLPI